MKSVAHSDFYSTPKTTKNMQIQYIIVVFAQLHHDIHYLKIIVVGCIVDMWAYYFPDAFFVICFLKKTMKN